MLTLLASQAFKKISNDPEHLAIIDLLRLYGLSIDFIIEVIKILRGKQDTFYSIESFSRIHPELHIRSCKLLKTQLKDNKNLTEYESHQEKVKFIRYSSGMKQLKAIINITIKYQFLNSILLKDILNLLETTIASDGIFTKNFKTAKNKKEIFQIKKMNNKNNGKYEIMLFSMSVNSKNNGGFFYDTSETEIKYSIRIKKFNSLKELLYYSKA